MRHLRGERLHSWTVAEGSRLQLLGLFAQYNILEIVAVRQCAFRHFLQCVGQDEGLEGITVGKLVAGKDELLLRLTLQMAVVGSLREVEILEACIGLHRGDDFAAQLYVRLVIGMLAATLSQLSCHVGEHHKVNIVNLTHHFDFLIFACITLHYKGFVARQYQSHLLIEHSVLLGSDDGDFRRLCESHDMAEHLLGPYAEIVDTVGLHAYAVVLGQVVKHILAL